MQSASLFEPPSGFAMQSPLESNVVVQKLIWMNATLLFGSNAQALLPPPSGKTPTVLGESYSSGARQVSVNASHTMRPFWLAAQVSGAVTLPLWSNWVPVHAHALTLLPDTS